MLCSPQDEIIFPIDPRLAGLQPVQVRRGRGGRRAGGQLSAGQRRSCKPSLVVMRPAGEQGK